MSEASQSFHLYSDEIDLRAEDRFVATISGEQQTKADLLTGLAKTLKFPDYFGYNWDALFDCLQDLSWIPQKEIIIMHKKLPGLPFEELRIYLTVLADAVSSWREKSQHRLAVWFPQMSKLTIASILTNEI